MADISELFGNIFRAGDTSDPRVNPVIRQRIALQLMANSKKGYPKNVGEGLTAIGDAIGDRGLTRQLEQADIAQQTEAAANRATAPGAGATPGFAPTDTSVPPAVGAINSAISGGATPVADMSVAPGAGPDEGGYNVLDAQAGGRFKPTPGYLQDAIAAREPNPDMQAYLGALSGSEAKNAQDVSPTGAAGPFQFTRGTGRQYGLMGAGGDQRAAIGPSVDAARSLTADNAAVFQRINGRPPTFQELALMHQQGGVTGARMAAGTGNAPAGNLAVNNIPPGAGPGQAVGQINRFYGMPNEPAPVRNGVAGALMAQQQPPAQGVPQPNPTLAGGGGAPGGQPDQRLAFTGNPADNKLPQGILSAPSGTKVSPSGIVTAPPVPSGIRAAPPPQVAQQQQPGFGYIIPKAGNIQPPEPTPVGSTEAWAMKQKSDKPNNPYLQQDMDILITREAAKRAAIDKINDQKYQADLIQSREQNKLHEESTASSAKRSAEGAELAANADLYRRTGEDPKTFIPFMNTEKQKVDAVINATEMQRMARKAIHDGVITGYGANGIVASAKFADWAWNNGLKGDLAANTEIMSAALKAGLRQAVEVVNGPGGTGVSNTDVRIAEGMAGSDPQLQLKTIMTIMDRASAVNHMRINKYETEVEKYLGGHPLELRFSTSPQPMAADEHIQKYIEAEKNNPADAQRMKANFERVNGPGSTDLAVARFERAQRKKARGE